MATTLFGDPIKFVDAFADPSTSSSTLPIVSTSTTNATSTNTDEKFLNQTNISIYATGNGATANTGLKKSNQTLSHACDSSTYVGKALFEVGAVGGKVIQAIRNAAKAILAYLGVNASSSGITNQLKKLAYDIKDAAKFIKDITTALNGFIAYVNAIKQLLAYILSLPAKLLAYFADCIRTLQKQLVAGFKSALSDTPDADQTKIDELSGAIKEVKSSIGEFTSAVATATATAAVAAASLVIPVPIAIANTEQQAAATQEIFSAAGFSSTSNNFSKP
jgi:hypothetical protein